MNDSAFLKNDLKTISKKKDLNEKGAIRTELVNTYEKKDFFVDKEAKLKSKIQKSSL